LKPAAEAITAQVDAALTEDIGSGDVSAALIDPARCMNATLITRQTGILAGQDWLEATFSRLDRGCQFQWTARDGDQLSAGQTLCRIRGPARALLTGERTALNFVQLLSGVATRTADYVRAVSGTGACILDTRKTLPGLRLAQKYAVTVGGGHNHRMGLYDLIMLKENHIAAAGSISDAIKHARELFPQIPVEVEVENLDQLAQALAGQADRIMLDNFELTDLEKAVRQTAGKAVLEASGGITLETVGPIARTGVNDISVGELTKSIDPLDLSLRFEE
jgi:nicotinate-nucleotide pyrophosphorylase (carboxylating)